MQNADISDDKWTRFFEDINHNQDGWATTIQVLDREFGPQNVASNLPFHGISFDTKGSRPNSLRISVGDDSERQVDHVVDLPLHVRQTWEANGSLDIEIEPASGSVTLIHFQK